MAVFDPEITKENGVKITDYISPANIGNDDFSKIDCNPHTRTELTASSGPINASCVMQSLPTGANPPASWKSGRQLQFVILVRYSFDPLRVSFEDRR